MTLIADGLMIAAALVAAIYCHVLARRLNKLRDLDNGLGGAISALAHQVDEMRVALDGAKKVSGASVKDLAERTARAEIAAGRLELLLATIHDRDGAQPIRPAPEKPQRDEAARDSAPAPDRDVMAQRGSARPGAGLADPGQVVEALREEIARAVQEMNRGAVG